MARTIGKRWPTAKPRGDYAAKCDYCDVLYRRSQLRRLPNGALACFGPGTNDDAMGRDEVTLSRANAEAAKERKRTPRFGGGGGRPDARDVLYPLIDVDGEARFPRVLVIGKQNALNGATEQWVNHAMIDESFESTYVPTFDTEDPPSFSDYDVVVFALFGAFSSSPPVWLSQLVDWVASGGGLVVSEWLAYIASPGSGWEDLGNIAAFERSDETTYGVSDSMTVEDSSHPIMVGLPESLSVVSHGSLTASATTNISLRSDATLLATTHVTLAVPGDWPGVAVRNHGEGRVVHVNSMYAIAKRPARGSHMWKLMQRSAWWAAGGTT